MLSTAPSHLTYVPFHDLAGDETAPIRFPDAGAVSEIKASFIKSGQTHPIFIEEIHPRRYAVLDGHRRVAAVRAIHKSGGTWEKMLAHIFQPSDLTALLRFQLIAEKNLGGKSPFKLMELARFFRAAALQGVGIPDMAKVCRRNGHEVADLIELGKAPEPLAALLNEAPVDPALALVLARRYESWIKTPHASKAGEVVKQLLGHARAERMTLKSWRFLLDFYWPDDRPFLAGA